MGGSNKNIVVVVLGALVVSCGAKHLEDLEHLEDLTHPNSVYSMLDQHSGHSSRRSSKGVAVYYQTGVSTVLGQSLVVHRAAGDS